jgi:hypothetical protein
MAGEAGGGGGGGGGGLTGVVGVPGDEIVVSEQAASVRMARLAIVASFSDLRIFMKLPSKTPCGAAVSSCRGLRESRNPLERLVPPPRLMTAQLYGCETV